jgi:hypothetical protein
MCLLSKVTGYSLGDRCLNSGRKTYICFHHFQFRPKVNTSLVQLYQGALILGIEQSELKLATHFI